MPHLVHAQVANGLQLFTFSRRCGSSTEDIGVLLKLLGCFFAKRCGLHKLKVFGCAMFGQQARGSQSSRVRQPPTSLFLHGHGVHERSCFIT